MLTIGTLPAAPVGYTPDGKDHSLECDPKYKLLLDHGAKVDKCWIGLWGICIDYTKILKLPDGEEVKKTITTLIDDWNTYHKFSYLMNVLSEEEYNRFLFSYSCERTRLQDGKKRLEDMRKKRDEEDKKKYVPQTTTSTTRYDNDDWTNSLAEFDRDRVISEYGW